MNGHDGGIPAEAVLLDVGGVMIIPDPAVIGPIVEQFGGDGGTDHVIRAQYGAMAAADDGRTLSWRLHHRALAVACRVPAPRLDDAVTELTEMFRTTHVWRAPVEGARAALARLAGDGRRVAIVSNSDGTVERLLAATGLCQVGPGPGVSVDAILDSHVVGSTKPDPGIFRMALERLGVGPDRAVHVGDTRFADVVGARAAGVRPVHVDPYGDCPQPDDHDHVRDLGEAVDRMLADRAD